MMYSSRLSLLGSTPNKTPINTGSLETLQWSRGPQKGQEEPQLLKDLTIIGFQPTLFGKVSTKCGKTGHK